jgi:hypothetical protein
MDPSAEIMYDKNSILITAILFVLILLANEIGFRAGRHFKKRTNGDVKTQTNTIQAGILGLLALILGFTFTMSLQRYNNRGQAVIEEANAIGTTLLRTQLLPTPYDSITHALIQQYVDLRLQISNKDLTSINERYTLNMETDKVQSQIWEKAIEAAEIDSRSVTTGYFIVSLNEMIDARGKRNAFLQLHVPEVILYLLFIVFIITGALMGYSSGLGEVRTIVPSVMMSFLIVLLVFIIIDLDRPKRGIIKVKQDSMMELKFK